MELLTAAGAAFDGLMNRRQTEEMTTADVGIDGGGDIKELPRHHQRPGDDEMVQRFYASRQDDATYAVRGIEL